MGKRKKITAAKASSASIATKKRVGDWTKSIVNTQNLKPLRDDGMLPPSGSNKIRLPGSEVVPRPKGKERVMFVDHMTRGLFFPLHPFVRGLLYTYGL
jgi:hypothetical protein